MKHETPPTPETDAEFTRLFGCALDDYTPNQEAAKEFSAELERQRDELANLWRRAVSQRDAMLEAIREAHDALRNLILAKRGGMQPANALIDATSQANDAVKKLKPFLL